MKNPRLKAMSLTACLLCLHAISLKGQEVFSSAGNSHEGNSAVSLYWTIGEIVTFSCEKNNVIVTQGFQQGELTVTAVEQADGLDFEILAYPNPVSDQLNLKIPEAKGNLTCTLYDLTGKALEQREMKSNNVSMPMAGYPPAAYLLRISEGNRNLKTFKIIKK